MTTETNINLRPANINDKDFILLNEFRLPAWRNAGEMSTTDIEILSDKLSRLPSDSAIFIAEDEQSNPLGFIHLTAGADYYFKEKHGHLSDIIDASAGEGQGNWTQINVGSRRIDPCHRIDIANIKCFLIKSPC